MRPRAWFTTVRQLRHDAPPADRYRGPSIVLLLSSDPAAAAATLPFATDGARSSGEAMPAWPARSSSTRPRSPLAELGLRLRPGVRFPCRCLPVGCARARGIGWAWRGGWSPLVTFSVVLLLARVGRSRTRSSRRRHRVLAVALSWLSCSPPRRGVFSAASLQRCCGIGGLVRLRRSAALFAASMLLVSLLPISSSGWPSVGLPSDAEPGGPIPAATFTPSASRSAVIGTRYPPPV